jgi:perosamine synthetase
MDTKNAYRIPLAVPIFDKEMEDAVLNALYNECFVLGEDVYKFEKEFAKYVGTKYAISTNSGTAALHLSLLALGIKNGDQVITTPFSFIATANAILHAGATPIFSDINIETYNIDPKRIRQNITEHTKAILPVHLYGYPCDMQQIMSIAQHKKIKVVEDACQAHGAEYNGMKIGTIGDVGCFSFYPSKNITVCGDGGMVVTNNEEIATLVIKLRDCGRKTKYEHDIIGYTARLNTVNAAIGRIQLKRLDQWNEKRIQNALTYNRLLSDLDEIVLPPNPKKQIKPVYHLYVIRAKNRDKLKEYLENNGVQCAIHYPLPIHLQPIYKEIFHFQGGEYPMSELASQTCLSLPMHPSLTKDDITYVCEKIHEFYKKAG